MAIVKIEYDCIIPNDVWKHRPRYFFFDKIQIHDSNDK